MMANTIDGYEVEAAEQIPDDEDPGMGIGAGDQVAVTTGDFEGQVGTVMCIARGKGFYAGQLIVDVAFEGSIEPERMFASNVELV